MKKAMLGSLGLVLAAVVFLTFTAEDPGHERSFFGLWRTRYFVAALALVLGASLLPLAARSKEALFATILVVFSGFVSWGFLEVLGLSGLVSYPSLFGRDQEDPLGRTPQPSIEVAGETLEDTSGPWGLSSKPIVFEYVTNPLGFRNVPDRVAADLYLLGDSILVSALVPYEQTLTARLEKQIGRPTMNIALIGISPRREQQLFRDTSLPVDGKLVLQFIFEGNDLLDTAAERDPEEPETPTLVHRSFAYNILMSLQRLSQPVSGMARRRTCTIDGQVYTFAWTRDSFAGHEHHAQHLFEELLGFKTEVEESGGTFGVVFVPAKLRVLASACEFPPSSDLPPVEQHLNPLREGLLRWSRTTDVPALDLTPGLIDAAKQGRIPWFQGDTHPNATGHEVASDAISQWRLVREWNAMEVPAGSP